MNRGEKYKFTLYCLTCKKEFPAKRKTRKFCSQYCTYHFKSKRFNNPELFIKEHELLQTKGSRPKIGTLAECCFCKKEVYIMPSRAKKSKRFFCGNECRKQHQKIDPKVQKINCKTCQKEIIVANSTMKWRPRVTCSKVCLKIYKRNEAVKRRQTYTKHQIDRLARYAPETEVWRRAVFERDNYTCQLCSVRGTYLEADHIKPWAYFPELRHNIDNGRTLCRKCHNTTKVSAKKLREIWGK